MLKDKSLKARIIEQRTPRPSILSRSESGKRERHAVGAVGHEEHHVVNPRRQGFTPFHAEAGGSAGKEMGDELEQHDGPQNKTYDTEERKKQSHEQQAFKGVHANLIVVDRVFHKMQRIRNIVELLKKVLPTV